MSTAKIGLVNDLRKRVRIYDLEQAQGKVNFKTFRTRFNNFFIFLERWQIENPDFVFEPTLNMIAFFCGFNSPKLMKKYLETENPHDRIHKPISEDEIRVTLAIFHEIRASSSAMSASWLRRHFPHEWSNRPDLTKGDGDSNLNVGMEEDGTITLKITRDYRGPLIEGEIENENSETEI